jgi:hypothetical protein
MGAISDNIGSHAKADRATNLCPSGVIRPEKGREVASSPHSGSILMPVGCCDVQFHCESLGPKRTPVTIFIVDCCVWDE